MAGRAHNLCAGCLLRLAALPAALAPEYEIETLLGSGRAGTTYLARALGSGALLTVKIVAQRVELPETPEVADTLSAKLIAFRHPGIAQTHAVDVDAEGNLRLVRDYVAGKPLSGWMAKADLPARQAVYDRIAAALADAHAHGLLHGHLVPTNVIMGAGGRPVIVDLGAHLALHALQGVTVRPDDVAASDKVSLEAIRRALTESS